MGTHNFALEPALFDHQDITERWGLEAEIGDSHPFGGSRGPTTDSSDFSGDVFFYGIGPSFDLVRTDRVRFTPVFELVGWHGTRRIPNRLPRAGVFR